MSGMSEFFQQPPGHHLSWLDQKVTEAFHHAPQKVAQAKEAVQSIKNGIDGLKALGHNYTVVEDKPGPVAEYPKAMYHSDGANKVVHSAEEEQSLGEGWGDRPGGRSATEGASLQDRIEESRSDAGGSDAQK